MPRAECGLWTAGHIRLHNVSDFLIWTAYLAIPVVLIKFAYSKRQTLPFRQLFWLFGIFILACGTTHLMDIVLFYNPLYRLSGLIKLVTAAASWGTVIALFHVVPVALQMRSPQDLEREIEQRQKAETELQIANEQLESHVAERTAELQKSTLELRASEHQFRLLIEAMPQIVWTSQPDGFLDYYNQRWVDYTGMSIEETQGWGWEPVIHPEDLPGCLQAWTHSINSGETYQIEYRFKRASDGAYRWHLGRALPLRDETGQISKWFGTCTDIDDQKRAEEALRETRDSLEIAFNERTSDLQQANQNLSHELEERKRIEAELQIAKAKVEETARTNQNMMEYSQDVICSIDADGNFVSLSPACQKVWGYSPEELQGRPCMDLVYPDDVEKTTRTNAGVENGDSVQSFENRYVRRDGSVVHMLWSAVWSQAEKSIFCVARDISDRKRAEEQLRAAKVAAEEASLAKSQFLANMSHEIRTPMNGVLGPIGLLLDSGLSESQRELTEIARFSAESLLGLINDILDLSKIEAGKLDIEPILFDLLEAMEETVGMMASKAEEKGLDLIVRFPPDVPNHVIGDPGRIRQVLINLVSNAIKFTSRGHVLVNVEVETQNESEVGLRISVQDSGIGISPDAIEHIFGRFNQADTSTTRRYGGTGLGLAISKQLIELMGGEIGATGVVGEGSTFYFKLTLPRALDATAAKTPDADLEQVRVLVVDDNAVNRRVLCEQLENWHLRNQSCAASDEALAALRQARAEGDPFEIAILDHQMPGTDGEELGQIIKADEELRDTVLVMLTSMGQKSDAKRLKAAGFAAHLLKPTRQSELFGALVNVWATRHDQENRPRESVTDSRASSAGERLKLWQGTRILVVEDNVVNQKVAAMILRSFGAEVQVAVDGLQALKTLDSSDFDLIFMDCEMPEMDGYQASAAIRKRTDAKRNLPIIAVTAKATQGDRERCLQAGMNDYLSKPVRSEDFHAALERWAPQPIEDSFQVIEESAAKSQASESPALDVQTVASLRELAQATDESLLDQIFEAFLDDGAERLETLRAALQEQDAEKMRRAAHTLKGASANIGAAALANLAQQLQALGDAKSLDGAPELLLQLEAEWNRVSAAIHIERGQS